MPATRGHTLPYDLWTVRVGFCSIAENCGEYAEALLELTCPARDPWPPSPCTSLFGNYSLGSLDRACRWPTPVGGAASDGLLYRAVDDVTARASWTKLCWWGFYLDGDGDTDFQDLTLLLAAFGNGCGG